jgi:hypothetical protein
MASVGKKSNSKSLSAAGKRVGLRKPAAKKARNLPDSATVNQHYVVCVRNDDYTASLELRKLYPLLEDAFAADHGMVRVIDESGEDYLYPSEFFVRVELPASIEKTLAKIA